jgi:hypothetical protein
MCRYKFITTDRKMLKRLITTHRPTLNLGCGIVSINAGMVLCWDAAAA